MGGCLEQVAQVQGDGANAAEHDGSQLDGGERMAETEVARQGSVLVEQVLIARALDLMRSGFTDADDGEVAAAGDILGPSGVVGLDDDAQILLSDRIGSSDSPIHIPSGFGCRPQMLQHWT